MSERIQELAHRVTALLEDYGFQTSKSGFEGEDNGELRPGDVSRINDAPGPSDKAEDGKAWVVQWAGGRGVAAFSSRSKMMAWAKEQGEWAEIVGIKYGDPVFGKDKTPVKITESFDPTKGAFRTKGGKFASLKKSHGAQWVPHVSPKVRLTVESLGGKVKAWTSGGGLAFVFEDADKANLAFDLLRESGHRVSKHDLPGVLCFHGMLGESITEGSAVIAMQGSITPSPLVLAARINALINKPQDEVTEDFSQVFRDEEAAEVAAVGLAQSHNKDWAVVAVDDDEDDCIEYLALPLDDAFERVAVDPAASIHAMYAATGKELADLDNDADDAQMNESELNSLTERHSALSRLSNSQARKKLAGGMKRRMRSARRSARNRLRRGFIYNAKSKARSALHRPNS